MTRVLIVRLGALGDVVHAIPMVASLRHAHPSVQVDWLVAPGYRVLLELVEGLHRAIGLDTRRAFGDAGVLPVTSELRRARYDVAFDAQGLLKSAVLARASGAARVIGFARENLREPAAHAFYTETVAVGQEDRVHIIQKNLALLHAVGIHEDAPRFPLRVDPGPELRSFIDRFGADGYALLNPGAAWPNKRWPPARFGAVAAAIHRAWGLASVVSWGPGEEALASAVVDASEGAAQLSPRTDIRALCALARHARVMVSGDTGPLHIAAAVGTPIVALFGPTLPARNGPWLPQDQVLSRADACECLYERRCRQAEACLESIPVDDVVRAVERRIAAASPRA